MNENNKHTNNNPRGHSTMLYEIYGPDDIS